MTVQQMLNSVSVIQRIMNLNLPIAKAYKVYSLAKQINEQNEFFINEEKKLIEKFNAKIEDGGRVVFEDPSNQNAFIEEHNKLLQYKLENLPVIELTLADLGDASFSPNELMLLEGVINITE